MSYLPVPLACAGVISVLGASPLIGDRFLRGNAAKKTVIPGNNNGLIYERILVLMDISSCASAMIERIAGIPGVGEAILLDVMDTATSSGAAWLTGHPVLTPRDRAKMRLVAHKNYLENLGTKSRVLVELADDNDVSGTILGMASREDASLLVVRSEPRSRILSAFLEDATTRILRRCTLRDMLIFPATTVEKAEKAFTVPPSRDLFSRVLCPTNLSSFSYETLAWVAGLELVSEIILVHIVASHGSGESGFRPDEAEQKLNELKNDLARKNLKITIITGQGDTAQEINRIAYEQNVSLILMPRCGLANYVAGGELGNTVAAVANRLDHPLLVRRPRNRPLAKAGELTPEEFGIAEQLWTRYHHQKADRENDRIFAVYLEDEPVSVAWCKRHIDGLEVDGVFTLEPFRRHEFARKAVGTLIDACGCEALYMHATLELVEFYRSMGFVPIPEDELPPTIKARFAFALGNLEGANACPMRRAPAREAPSNPIPAQ